MSAAKVTKFVVKDQDSGEYSIGGTWDSWTDHLPAAMHYSVKSQATRQINWHKSYWEMSKTWAHPVTPRNNLVIVKIEVTHKEIEVMT